MSIFIVSGLLIVKDGLEFKRVEDSFRTLRDSRNKFDNNLDGNISDSNKSEGQKEIESYPDMIGWIFIEGTSIDYPIMQSTYDPDFYLSHGLKKEESAHGVPFLSADCFDGSLNAIIYGHNMKDGTMFNNLQNYKDPSFRKDHPIIHCDLFGQTGQYEVFAVLTTTAKSGTAGFTMDYTQYPDISNSEVYKNFLEKIEAVKLYETGVFPQYPEKLLCLSTCDYTYPNGRLCIVAKELR